MSLSFKGIVRSKIDHKSKGTSNRILKRADSSTSTNTHVCNETDEEARSFLKYEVVKRLWEKAPSCAVKLEEKVSDDFTGTDKSMDVAMAICRDYIHQKLVLKGYPKNKIRLSAAHCSHSEYFVKAGCVLERLYPKVYTDVSRKIAMTMASSTVVKNSLTSVLEIMFRDSITWGKVVSMFAISASFAEECVQQGHSEFVDDVVKCVGNFVALHLVEWLVKQGGWVSKFKTLMG